MGRPGRRPTDLGDAGARRHHLGVAVAAGLAVRAGVRGGPGDPEVHHVQGHLDLLAVHAGAPQLEGAPHLVAPEEHAPQEHGRVVQVHLHPGLLGARPRAVVVQGEAQGDVAPLAPGVLLLVDAHPRGEAAGELHQQPAQALRLLDHVRLPGQQLHHHHAPVGPLEAAGAHGHAVVLLLVRPLDRQAEQEVLLRVQVERPHDVEDVVLRHRRKEKQRLCATRAWPPSSPTTGPRRST